MRSQFLTLLCVLTFLSCAWGLIDAVVSFLQTDAVSETAYVNRPATTPATPKQDAQTKKYFEDRSSGDAPTPSNPIQVRSLSVAQFIYSSLTLIGAILMFQLRRIGFWIYVAGIAIGVVMFLSLAGIGALNTSFGVFFSMLFAGLYWLTLKEMH